MRCLPVAMAASHPARARAPWCRRPICSGVSAYLLPASRFILLFCFSLTVASQCLRNDARLPRVTRPRVAPLSLEAAFFGPRRLSACGPSEGCSGGDAFRSRLENGLCLPLRWCRMSTPGLAPFVGLSCRGHPHSAARSWGAFLRMGETRPSRAPCSPLSHVLSLVRTGWRPGHRHFAVVKIRFALDV